MTAGYGLTCQRDGATATAVWSNNRVTVAECPQCGRVWLIQPIAAGRPHV